VSAEKLAALQRYYPSAQLLAEGGQSVVFLPGLKVDAPEGQIEFDGLLHPQPHTGYSTRLFITRTITAPLAQNWTAHSLCGKSWWACSWQNVGAELPWIDMLANHLRAFR